MMNSEKMKRWNGYAASIPGSGHIRRGIPCQDASLVLTSPRPALIVCDGRGSAKLSHFGAQGAVEAFRFQLSVLEPFLANLLDSPDTTLEQWQKFCRILYRTLMQVKLDLGIKHELPEKEFDFTVVFAIAGTKHIGCFQVGDGSLVLCQNGECVTVFPPEKGEFANQTHFLRAGGEDAGKFQSALHSAETNSGIAATSDGPEHLMFRLSDMTPGRIFDCLFSDLKSGELCRQDIMDYLTRREWDNDPRGNDDRSLVLLAPVIENTKIEPVAEMEQQKIPQQLPVPPAGTLPKQVEVPHVEPVCEPVTVKKPQTGNKLMLISAVILLLAVGTYLLVQNVFCHGEEETVTAVRVLIPKQEEQQTSAESEKRDDFVSYNDETQAVPDEQM